MIVFLTKKRHYSVRGLTSLFPGKVWVFSESKRKTEALERLRDKSENIWECSN